MGELKAYLCIQARKIERKAFSRHSQTLAVENAPEAAMEEVYLAAETDKVIAAKDAEIARLKGKRLDVKDAAHVLKAFKFYLSQLTHCAYDELTAQWIIDNWEQDYKRVEAAK